MNPKSTRTKATLKEKLRTLRSLDKEFSSVQGRASHVLQAKQHDDDADTIRNMTAGARRPSDAVAALESSHEPSISSKGIYRDASSEGEADNHVVENSYRARALLGARASSSSQYRL